MSIYYFSMFEDEEFLFQLEMKLFNLTILLNIKETLGDAIDITDRLFGFCNCGTCTNMPFLESVLHMFVSPEESPKDFNANINEDDFKELAKKYPAMFLIKNIGDPIWDDSCHSVISFTCDNFKFDILKEYIKNANNYTFSLFFKNDKVCLFFLTDPGCFLKKWRIW